MIKEIYKDIYIIEVDLPDTPLKVLNAYLIKGNNRNLLIDTGFRSDISMEAHLAAMDQIGYSMENTDIFLTHCHSDHCGLTSTLIKPTTKVISSQYTADSVMENDGTEWEVFMELSSQSGLPVENVDSHPGYTYATKPLNNVEIVSDGDIIKVGDYNLRCLDTTGHTPGHICLYDKEHGIVFTGDHVLAEITPNNTIWDKPWGIKVDLLGDYLKNLNKIKDLDAHTLFPSHRAIITNPTKRIDELIEHHEIRLNAVRQILEDEGSLHGADVASRMQWRIRARNWDEFPMAQKMFATGEAMSHLVHLKFLGEVKDSLVDGVVYYSSNK